MMQKRVQHACLAIALSTMVPALADAQSDSATPEATRSVDTPAPATEAPVTAGESDSDTVVSTEPSKDALHIEEIIVTAQRRKQNLQEVPVAVTAVSSEALAEAGVLNVSNMTNVSPSIRFDASNNASKDANIKIRGIGTTGEQRAFEGAVGVFIDGVYRTRAGQALANWVDIDGIQVLRGPQGTLFGKNTSAGALLITSKAPRFDGVSGDYEFSAGDYSMRMARGAINAPISEKLAFRVAGSWLTSEGYVKNPNDGEDYNDRHPRALKAQLLFAPTETLQLRLIADWSEEFSNCCMGAVESIQGPTQALTDAFVIAQGLTPPSGDPDDYEAALSKNSQQHLSDKGIVLHADWSPDENGSLHSVTAYRRWAFSNPTADADFSALDLVFISEPFSTDFFSQEVTWNGKTDLWRPVDYVLGAYFSHEKLGGGRSASWGSQAQAFWDTLLAGNGLPAGTVSATEGVWQSLKYPGENLSAAVFAQGDFKLSDDWSLITGLRYSYDRKKGAAHYIFNDPHPNAVLQVLGVYPGPDFDATYKDDAISGTLSLQRRFSEDLMAYLTYSRGYKAGGINLDANGAGTVANNPDITPGAQPLDPRYKPEYNDGYELGLKTDYLGGRARSNIAVFYNDLKDLQIAQFIGLQFTVINAPDATVYGAEIENSFMLSESLTLGANVVWLGDASYGKSAQLGVLSGRDFTQAPEWTGNVSLNLDRPVSDKYGVIGRFAALYAGEEYNNTAGLQKRDAVTTYDFSLGLKALESRWTLSTWCRNCSDERYVSQNKNTPIRSGNVSGFVAPPRTYGVTLRGTF